MLHPYRRGRVPVVLVHGTASSPARWADMVNELQNDPVLRGRIQFWLFTYNTSQPILLSASELRESLRTTIAELDPDGQDPALRHLVLIGHSQGGLLTRLMVTDSGTRFWDASRRCLWRKWRSRPPRARCSRRRMFFAPLPYVKRVVFIATPHRGSFRVSTLVLDLVRRLVTLPVTVVRGDDRAGAEQSQRGLPQGARRHPDGRRATCAPASASSGRCRRARSPQG